MAGSKYDKYPTIELPALAEECWSDWEAVLAQLNAIIDSLRSSNSPRKVLAIECYTGIHTERVEEILQRGLNADYFLTNESVFKSAEEIDALVAPYLGGNDAIFGYLSPLHLESFLDEKKRAAFEESLNTLEGVVVLYGTGAVLCAQSDVIVYADMPRWEGQLRQRRDEVSNLGVENRNEKASLQYKRSYFIDWRVLDRLKQELLPRCDYLLDTTITEAPRLVTGKALRAGLDQAVRQPFRVVPFFDPAPWGGQWMKEAFDLSPDVANFGWGFDCVPEENSLVLQFGTVTVEIPAINLVFYRPLELLGKTIYNHFGAEFPIRFDFLDTVGGGNLSLQVHPMTEYIREKFGMFYTQDESYYILEATEGATVFLGMKTGADPEAMFDKLSLAQTEGDTFPAEEFVNRWPARKHDHFLIPAGTIHCSGANTVVLEISATPYIFTFKLWDWGRLGLDGLPRPINLERGRSSLQTDRDSEWVRNNLIHQVEPIAEGRGWREERTGLHPLEFIETRRHWFTGPVSHDTQGTVNVLCLVEGDEIIVEGAFTPFVIHYAETFIVPAAVGPYTIRPLKEGTTCATLKAFVRSFPSAP